MRLNIQALTHADVQTKDLLSDTFEKKVGDWAYASHYLSSGIRAEEPYGRFSMQPIDAPVMNYVEEHIKGTHLPTGHLYEQALQQALQEVAQHPDSQALVSLLQQDIALRDYFKMRQMEQVFS